MGLLKNLGIIYLASLMMSCTAGRPPRFQSWSHGTGAEAYERSFWKAIQDRDFDAAERRLAPIYTLTTSAGILGREQAAAYFRSLGLKDIEIADLHVVPEGDDMVVSYAAIVETRSTSTPRRYYMISVWQQVKRGWIMTAHSEVPAS